MLEVKKEDIRDIVASVINEYSLNISLFDEECYNMSLTQIGIDSLMFIQIIVKLEDEYQISVPTEYLSFKEIPNINAITEMIKKVRNNASI